MYFLGESKQAKKKIGFDFYIEERENEEVQKEDDRERHERFGKKCIF